LELRQLRYFVKIVELGSLGRAALELEVGVSALSQQISKLENELSTRLLNRTSTGVTPTSAGVAFLHHAQLTLRQAENAVMAAHRGRMSGYVSVGLAPPRLPCSRCP
jgi:Transcriptional regulator